MSAAALATDAIQLEAPRLSIEQALAIAQRHVASEHIDVSDCFIAAAAELGYWRTMNG